MKLFSLIYQTEIHTTSNKKVIPQKEFSTILEAQEILELANKEAKQLKQETLKQCEELKKRSEEEGYQKGLSDWNEQLMHFEREVRRIRHETQKMVLPLAIQAAKKIVGKELELFPNTIADIVEQALIAVKQNRKFTIYVNKADKEALETNKPEIKKILEHLEHLSIQERSDIAPGGCVIETETGIINATIENQWRSLEAAFERYMKH